LKKTIRSVLDSATIVIIMNMHKFFLKMVKLRSLYYIIL